LLAIVIRKEEVMKGIQIDRDCQNIPICRWYDPTQ
jgi:hypothetical protein